MKRILLCCAAGMSTSLLVTKIKKAADEQGIETEVWAEPLEKVRDHVGNADVLLLGPQVKYALSELKKVTDEKGIPIDVINMMDYGMMNGPKVLEQALKLIG